MSLRNRCLTIFLLLIPTLGWSQQQLNLDFEIPSVEGVSRPWGWQLAAWGVNTFRLDSTQAKQGTYALMGLGTSLDGEPAPALQYNLEPFVLAGKQIQLAGFVRADELQGLATVRWGYSYVDAAGEYQVYDSILIRVTENTDWQEYASEFYVPRNVATVFLKIRMQGMGRVWFDDFQWKVEGEAVEELSAAAALTEAQQKELRTRVSPFKGPFLGSGETNDLSFFQEVAGSSSLIALGESTHGTREFFALKHRVLAHAVQKLGVRVFALEDSQTACQRVNRYVLGQSDEPVEEAMSGLFAVWNTEEVKELIDWIRAYNAKHSEDPVYFTGFDLQDGLRPLQALSVFLQEQKTDLYTWAQTQWVGLEEGFAQVYFAPDSTRQQWLETTRLIELRVQEAAKDWLSSATSMQDSVRIQEGMQYATLLRQFTENAANGFQNLHRDRFMAENVRWLHETRYPGKRMLIWAHDVHISKCQHEEASHNLNYGEAMGGHLARWYGNNYQAFGLMTYEGAYLAFTSYSYEKRVHAPLYPAPVGSLEEALHRVAVEQGTPYVFLRLSDPTIWMRESRPIRFANHVNIDYGFWQRISVADQFDGVFFLDQTSPSVPLK